MGRGVAAVKMSQRNMHRTALLLMVGSGILLTTGNGTDAYPIVGYSQAVAASEDSTGILLEQSVQGLVPLLGYGDIRETRTQPPEDESTWHTLTTEELLGADGILPQSGGKETQEVEEPAESTSATAGGEFVPAGRQMQIDLAQLKDYESLVGNFYAIDANTMIGSDQLSVDKFMEIDMTMAKQEGEGPQILIYHTHSQEAFADSVPGDVNTGIVGVGEYLTQVLTEQYGYRVLHHTGQYDVETRDNAYSRALPEVEQLLAKNPSIQVVIDLHRDEVAQDTRLVTELQGRPTAKFMFFNGLSRTRKTGDIDYLRNENQEANLAFSFQMQLKAAEYYPGLTRRIYLKGYRYNMHLCPRTLLVELGAQNNTYEEAINACDPLAHILDMVLGGE
ncbi:MAG: stage II sporulation protein P [Lachnospiraceae bacterium]|nr:stage II sporulation protein P [Lachnospiraceae bacterium]MCI6515674.1 stage II sporulation protein P [Lachnospiraceae bacterium]MDY3658143.1 stage II sporulation protein P [Lachnospiraceae bacterium]